MRWRRGMALLSLGTALSLFGQVDAGVSAARTVGVVDFYAPSQLGAYGIVPERFAANDLSMLLTQAAVGQFTVVSRASIGRAEASLGWQTVDALRFDRLRALAQALGADTLIVGQISLLVNLDGGRTPPNASADTNLVLQVFDATQGRFAAEIRQSASVVAGLQRDLLTEQVLHDALVRAVPALAAALVARSP
jgi:hypothetical protein